MAFVGDLPITVLAAGPSTSSQFFGSLLIGLREGLEASIVVMVLVAFLVKSDRRDALKWVWLGVGAALAMTISVFMVIQFGENTISGLGAEAIAGIASLVAVAIVTHETDDGDVTVDGMHRRRVGSTDAELRARLHGYLPVSRIRTDRADVAGRIAATVEFNRARGEHGTEAMSALVRLLYELGWTDERIQQELGMQLDEVIRLKQITGIAALFTDRDFSQAWEPV